MRFHLAFALCAAFLISPLQVGAQSDAEFDEAAARRAAEAAELAWLEHEIGRFASGRATVLEGALTVTQRDRGETLSVEGQALAALSADASPTLTIVFPERRLWLRLAQPAGPSGVTQVSRLRSPNANAGISATCADCLADLAGLARGPVLIRLSADGALLDVSRSRFAVEVSGVLRPVPPRTLRLGQVLPLGPGIENWSRRPSGAFRLQGSEAVRDVTALLRQPAPPPRGDGQRFTCVFETGYTARHVVPRNDLARFGVRDVVLGDTSLCCVDHDLHDGSALCDREDAQ